MFWPAAIVAAVAAKVLDLALGEDELKGLSWPSTTP